MELSGVSWSSVLCRSNIANGKNQPESSCRAALMTMRCSWTRKISARPTSWPRHRRRRCLRPTTRRTPFANDVRSSITALALTLFTSGPLSSPRAITVHFCFYFIALRLGASPVIRLGERNRNGTKRFRKFRVHPNRSYLVDHRLLMSFSFYLDDYISIRWWWKDLKERFGNQGRRDGLKI